MGFLIVIVTGAMLGWLAVLIVDRPGRAQASSCIFVGVVGASMAALLADNVPLTIGVSAGQLLWSVIGGVFAIVALNTVVVARPLNRGGNF